MGHCAHRLGSAAAGLALFCATVAFAERLESLEVTGYYKNFLAAYETPDGLRWTGQEEDDWLLDDLHRLRVKAAFDPQGSVSWLLHQETRWRFGEATRLLNQGNAVLQSVAGSTFAPSRPRFLDLSHDSDFDRNQLLELEIDRLQMQAQWDRAQLTLGRQSVSWGSGLIWTPSDLFAGFAPNEIDRDEKLGIDVLRLQVWPTLGTSIDVIAEPLDSDRHYRFEKDDSSLATRIKTRLGETDAALSGGYVAGDWVLGTDLTGYLGQAGWRAEALQTWVDESDEPDHFQGVLGLDRSILAPWDPYVAVEYFYHGRGVDDASDYSALLSRDSFRRAVQRGTAYSLGRHYAGLIVGLMPSALVRVNIQTTRNLNDDSWREFMTVTWSLGDNTDLIVGANLGFGPDRGELAEGDLVYTYFKWYF